jgi:serine protease Do
VTSGPHPATLGVSAMGARLLFVLACFGTASCASSTPPGAARSPTAPPVAPLVAGAPEAPARAALTPAQIAARAMPAVVTIRTGSGLGTGFVVRPEGWIATNFHVIASGAHVTVTTGDARQFDVVEVLAASPEHDLALVRVEAQGLPPLSLGDSDAMRPGDPVVAIGNPLGLEDTVSNGLISAVRTIHEGAEVLQISAPIAPGSSGGPIFNDRGEVIGVAAAFLQRGQNLNFGVPIRYLARMMQTATPTPFAEFAAQLAKLRERSAEPTEPGFARHPLAVLDGCSPAARGLIAKMISDAVEVGAPLYNEGKADACYHVYDGAASDLERRLPRACHGPTAALAEAQTRAASSNVVAVQAWVMRHEFDALMEVLFRAAHGVP